MCDHVWIFEARTLSTQPVRVTQESGRHGPAPGEYPASDAAYPLFHIQALLTKTPIFWRSVSEGPILTRWNQALFCCLEVQTPQSGTMRLC
jgi:hypothetical protein